MSASAIPLVKQRLRGIDSKRAEKLADKALKLESAAEVRELARKASNRQTP
jgi:phosphotransferase system enzyme I (PtsI)